MEIKNLGNTDETLEISSIIEPVLSNKETDIHKVKSNGLSDNDEELIDLAYSTTYRYSIKNYIKIADTAKARKILQDILNSNEIEWED